MKIITAGVKRKGVGEEKEEEKKKWFCSPPDWLLLIFNQQIHFELLKIAAQSVERLIHGCN